MYKMAERDKNKLLNQKSYNSSSNLSMNDSKNSEKIAISLNEIKKDEGKEIKFDDIMRNRLEQHFGYNLSNVKMSESKHLNELGTPALAKGNNILFKAGAFDSKSQHGQKIIAHEVSHVIQQQHRAAKTDFGGMSFDTSLENDANAQADNFLSGNSQQSGDNVGLQTLSNVDYSAAPIQGFSLKGAFNLTKKLAKDGLGDLDKYKKNLPMNIANGLKSGKNGIGNFASDAFGSNGENYSDRKANRLNGKAAADKIALENSKDEDFKFLDEEKEEEKEKDNKEPVEEEKDNKEPIVQTPAEEEKDNKEAIVEMPTEEEKDDKEAIVETPTDKAIASGTEDNISNKESDVSKEGAGGVGNAFNIKDNSKNITEGLGISKDFLSIANNGWDIYDSAKKISSNSKQIDIVKKSRAENVQDDSNSLDGKKEENLEKNLSKNKRDNIADTVNSSASAVAASLGKMPGVSDMIPKIISKGASFATSLFKGFNQSNFDEDTIDDAIGMDGIISKNKEQYKSKKDELRGRTRSDDKKENAKFKATQEYKDYKKKKMEAFKSGDLVKLDRRTVRKSFIKQRAYKNEHHMAKNIRKNHN